MKKFKSQYNDVVGNYEKLILDCKKFSDNSYGFDIDSEQQILIRQLFEKIKGKNVKTLVTLTYQDTETSTPEIVIDYYFDFVGETLLNINNFQCTLLQNYKNNVTYIFIIITETEIDFTDKYVEQLHNIRNNSYSMNCTIEVFYD